MIGSASEGNPGVKRLVIGFDAGCLTCSDLARRIEERVGGSLEIRSLQDPQVKHWREQALEHPPWAPTLIEVGGIEKVRAWTGPRMAIRLARALGPISTYRVIQALGEAGASKTSTHEASATDGHVAMSREQFLKFTGGAALALGFFSGLPSPAQATEDELNEEALARAFSIIEEIPDPVAARGEEASSLWLKRRMDTHARDGDIQTQDQIGCVRAILVAIIANAIPVLKIRRAIAVFGGARNLAAFIIRNYKRFRRLGNGVRGSIRKSARAVSRRVFNATGDKILGAVLALLSLDGVRKECF